MNNPIPFECKAARAWPEVEKQANAKAEQAGRWLTELTARKAEANAAESRAFASAYASDDVADFLAAQTQLRDIETVANSVLNRGSPDEIKRVALGTPENYDLVGSGFGERITAIEKRIPANRKALGIRYCQLTEAGLPPGAILSDALAAKLGGHNNDLTAALAVAVAGKKYCDARGVGCAEGNRSWSDLINTLRSPLPVAPVIA